MKRIELKPSGDFPNVMTMEMIAQAIATLKSLRYSEEQCGVYVFSANVDQVCVKTIYLLPEATYDIVLPGGYKYVNLYSNGISEEYNQTTTLYLVNHNRTICKVMITIIA
ncbi:MAG: hypothetical protein J6A89_03755 [Clostridia bacterium]|nr:hypothetical protein [Clostridia bacterium]